VEYKDGLSITAAEPWFKVKVQVITRYVQSFIGHVAGRAGEIIVVDLCAGSGLYSHGHQKEIFPGAAFTLMGEQWPISQWIFCEPDATQAQALRSRLQGYFRQHNTTVLDCNPADAAGALQGVLPKNIRGGKVAVVCLVDPFSFSVPFATIDKLAALNFSFIMPFTWPLNERMNYAYYNDEHADKLKRFLGVGDLQRLTAATSNAQFYKHIVRMYQTNMLMLGLNTALSAHPVSSPLMQVPAYYVGFFSRKYSTKVIQHSVYSSDQIELF
jgi:three-Cys-motif partner protein